MEFYKTPEDLSELPNADLIICKDVLQHLPNEYIFKFLKILPKYKYALITNDGFKHPSFNRDINPGEWRSIDLRKSPFNLSAKNVYTRPGDLHINFVLKGLKTPRFQWYFTERKYTLLWENPHR